jgi:hypothetical protein
MILIGLEGTKITVDANKSLQMPSETWAINEKLDEISLLTT